MNCHIASPKTPQHNHSPSPAHHLEPQHLLQRAPRRHQHQRRLRRRQLHRSLAHVQHGARDRRPRSSQHLGQNALHHALRRGRAFHQAAGIVCRNRSGLCRRKITQNFVIANYHAVWPLDHDDGSCYYYDYDNVLVYGGFKTYLGHSKICGDCDADSCLAENNLYIYPDTKYADETNEFFTEPYCCITSVGDD